MRNFIIGVIVGIVVNAVGFSGLARILDNSVDSLKTYSQSMAK